jgi:hypothetical protein
LANGISQEQYDKNLFDAYVKAQSQGLSDAQIESSMNQYGISAADVARATGVTPASVQARLDAAAPTTPEEIAYNKTAMDELAVREAQWATQQKQNATDWAAKQAQNVTDWAAQQKQNELNWAAKQGQNVTDWASQQKQNELAWKQDQIQNERNWAAQQKANADKLAAQQAGLLAQTGATSVTGTTPFANATQGFAQNFNNYTFIPIGSQYNPNVVGGTGSPYAQIMGQMKPFSNPYANMPVNTPLGGYNPALYEQINAANVAKAEAETAAAAADPGQISDGLAKGGMVHGGLMFGMNPPGPDDGAVNLDMGEYVIKKSSVDKYGRGLLDMINEGKVPAKKMKSLLG